MNQDTFANLKQFIQKEFGIKEGRIQLQSRIEEDLRITGSDAVDLIVSFGEKFKVDVSNFMAADYFEPEGMNYLLPRTIPNKKVLTINHLLKAIELGKLDEYIIISEF